ncbi:MAG: HAD-IB family phosphatase [Deltaproteobacteria bacterium]|nr:HAD-IB family phosphatase [Deltaproteobacteria bacterium]
MMRKASDRQVAHDLIAFDVDGTLVGHPEGKVVWELLNHHFGGDGTVNRRRFDAFRGGHITYAEWVDLDVEGWLAARATRAQIANVILEQLSLMAGVAETLAELRGRGYRLAIISGTLDLTLELLLGDHAFDAVFANRIWFDRRGYIEGWAATPFDMAGKALALRHLCQTLAVPLERTVFVGDNVNDLDAMRTAGLAVAYEPKHGEVEAAARHVIHSDLRRLLALLETA